MSNFLLDLIMLLMSMVILYRGLTLQTEKKFYNLVSKISMIFIGLINTGFFVGDFLINIIKF